MFQVSPFQSFPILPIHAPFCLFCVSFEFFFSFNCMVTETSQLFSRPAGDIQNGLMLDDLAPLNDRTMRIK